MNVIETELPGVLIIEPDIFPDQRGIFMETYHEKRYKALGIPGNFVQDNLSYSIRGTLRGLHFQLPHAQAKLVQVLMGEVFDVVVDIRRGSPTFGRWFGLNLTDKNRRQIYIPEGCAHGFCVLSETALCDYKCTDFYAPNCECGVLWSDPAFGIVWPMEALVLSNKDSKYLPLKDIPPERLPVYRD